MERPRHSVDHPRHPPEGSPHPREGFRTLRDDLGAAVRLPVRPTRVVSLVPSLTEAIATDHRALLVGATDWCTHPADLEVTRVRGTKNPDVAAIVALDPDLVICTREENRELDVRRLRAAGIAVWVMEIESVDQALDAMERMFGEVLAVPAPPWLAQARQVWQAPAPSRRVAAAIPIWRDPWMVVGAPTFTNDLLARVGVDNVFAGPDDLAGHEPCSGHDRGARYPQVGLEDIRSRDCLVLLPDEPYAFSPADGPECFARARCLEGRMITWYGPSMVQARAYLEELLSPDLSR